LGTIIYSCSHNCPQKEVQLITNEKLQYVIDSITSLNSDRNTYELFVHKGIGAGYLGFMLLYIGTEAFYDDNMLSSFYFLSNNHKVKIYSGFESYFNLPEKKVNYGRMNGIREDENHLLWGIYMYKDNIVGVHSVDSANPFLLIPAPPLSYYDSIIE
jgi:hypothetical protein